MVSVKLKYWLVVLLAAILPLKGAMAVAGVLCHVPASHQAQSVHDHRLVQAHGTLPDVGAQDDSHHSHGADASAGEVQDVSCLACAAVCGASPLPTTLGFGLPVSEPTRDWRDFAVIEPPDMSLDGLKRPPRRI